MSFEVDSYSATWAHIALCADLTWAAEPPDDFIIANQRLWAQHCRISQVLQETTVESQSSQTTNNQTELSDKRTNTGQSQEYGGSSGLRSVKDVIPESRLAQFYGNFYYDEVREKCYTSPNERANGRGYNGQGCENSDLTECWMLPEVEYWFRKLVDDSLDRNIPRRRRQYRMLADDDLPQCRAECRAECVNGRMRSCQEDSTAERIAERLASAFAECVNGRSCRAGGERFAERLASVFGSALARVEINGHVSAASERWDSAGARAAGEEAALAARVLSVRPLWAAPARSPPRPRAPSPPPIPRKIRARRRQPRRLAGLAPPPPAYCLEVPAQLFCDPSCKFHFDPPRPPQLADCQRAMGRLSASVQAAMRATAARCPPYRGTNISRYAPTGQRPARCPDRRYGVWWPRDHPSPRLERFQLAHVTPNPEPQNTTKPEPEEKKETKESNNESKATQEETQPPEEKPESPKTTEQIAADGQLPSTSTGALDTNLRKKRLYSTVLSMSAPTPINLSPVGCVRLTQKLVAPGLLKLNPKIVLPSAKIRPPNVDNKFEELEKEALEQYKASDESIDTKFRELEKQAVEQYSTSNSNTSCSSGNSAEKGTSSSPSVPDETKNKKQPAKFHKDKSVDSVVIYSQNFPDLNTKGHTSSVMNLKNFHTPPRGEKKEQTHRPTKLRNIKSDSQRAASDTDYEAREKSHKGAMRWTLHVVPPKKRHLTLCVSDFSSDEELEDASGAIKDAAPRIKNHVGGKVKMSAHGGGDLHPIMRKT